MYRQAVTEQLSGAALGMLFRWPGFMSLKYYKVNQKHFKAICNISFVIAFNRTILYLIFYQMNTTFLVLKTLYFKFCHNINIWSTISNAFDAACRGGFSMWNSCMVDVIAFLIMTYVILNSSR